MGRGELTRALINTPGGWEAIMVDTVSGLRCASRAGHVPGREDSVQKGRGAVLLAGEVWARSPGQRCGLCQGS